jgi:hypothetical protein
MNTKNKLNGKKNQRQKNGQKQGLKKHGHNSDMHHDHEQPESRMFR